MDPGCFWTGRSRSGPGRWARRRSPARGASCSSTAGTRGGYATRLLGYWVREKQIMPLEEAVRKLTFMVASIFGLRDRGLLRPGGLFLNHGIAVRRSPSLAARAG